MSNITKTQIEMALSHVMDPDLGRNLVELNMIENIAIENLNVSFDLVLTTAGCPMKNKMKEDCINAIHELVDRNANVQVNLTARPQQMPDPKSEFPNIKHTILVASGKGGVGKSTVAANLAIALAATGAKVALCDADIYGPSVPTMFHIDAEDIFGEMHDGKEYMVPIEKYGIKLMSIGFLVDAGKALVWRGPMASNALKQMLTQTWWGDIDYFVVDMPPGTGDVQLTVAQTLPVSGAVMVSTPQQVAIADVTRAAEMFAMEGVKIPILGFVENMAYFTPAELPNNKYYIFGKGGCVKLAKDLNLPVLGEIPLVQNIAESGDEGKPVAMWTDTPSPENIAFRNLADNVIKEICKLSS